MSKLVSELTPDQLEAQRAYHREYFRRRYREDTQFRERQKAASRYKNLKRARLYRLYGLVPEVFDEMSMILGGKCMICRRVPRRLVVDHDHVTEKVRGLLCDDCNTSIGRFNDDPVLLERAAQYLRLNGVLLKATV